MSGNIDITETLEYIHSVKWQGSKPGLERTRELLAALGNPEKKLRFVHVAGTNGKGSTSAYIASVLQKAGYRTGLYTSPFIVSFNERMQVNGEYITDDELVRMTDAIRPHADAMEDAPTEFELITALAMMYFLQKECDVVVLEVGMGGELDSTNVIDVPEVAVIATIGYDHVKELGPMISDIAMAKAGIIKGGDVVVYGGVPDVEAVFERVCGERGARLHHADFSRISEQHHSLHGTEFLFEPYGRMMTPLAGAYQPKNAALAITALETLRGKGYRISDADIAAGIAAVRWPGRFEALGERPAFILDGAHNPEALEVAADSLRSLFGDRKIVFVMGVMADKDVDEMVGYIAPMADAFFAVRPDNPRAMDANALAALLERHGARSFASGSVKEGVARAIERAGPEGIVCALGSLYFSADIRSAYEAVRAGA
ncbi:MAG: bifunctional folylpolyglutamate synthase/dihydrofolate synthase [Oscillospiraceae bacterium]|nr:bifunctional folylpolyglutamate synthase/dihydrofolate synthase [Oscillospiraceae bacterium]